MRFFFIICLLVFINILLFVSTGYSTVTELKARFSKGKTFITWIQDSDSDSTYTYNIYRSGTQIQDVSSLVPLCTVPHGSGYDPRHDIYHVIVDSGSPLSSTTGLFVYTPKTDESVYYAVTSVNSGNENTSVSSGQNSLAAPVAEEYWEYPSGVLREKYSPWGSFMCYVYFYWMDYFDWQHAYDYYGTFFQIFDNNNKSGRNEQNVPLMVFLHGASDVQHAYPTSSGASEAKDDAYMLSTKDYCILDEFCPTYGGPGGQCLTWWYGLTNHYGEHAPQPGDTIVNYTQLRYVYYLKSIINDPRFSIDTNRIYAKGGSMGGFGSYMAGFHFPEIFAAVRPHIGMPNILQWGEGRHYVNFGAKSLGITARNGINIYNWVNSDWIARNYISIDFPPIVTSHGSQDVNIYSNNQMREQILYDAFKESKHAVWGQWFNSGHNNTGSDEDIVAGTYLRFRKDELYPAFTNATNDDNYGTNFVNAGKVNGYIDWTSSLHDMGLANDDLVDNKDSIVITMKSDSANTSVDVTPRRIQNLPVVVNGEYIWKNIDVASGNTVDSGNVAADQHGRITVTQFSISQTGNRLVLYANGDVVAIPDNIKSQNKRDRFLNVSPNPFMRTAVITYYINKSYNAKMEILNISGSTVRSIKLESESGTHKIFWDGYNNLGQL
ncbi:MAG: hypothetical protein ABIA63_00175, partial [bacterium]